MSGRYLLDTNIVIALFADDEAVTRAISEADEIFIELYAAVVSIPSIGRSLLGENEYRNLRKKLKPGEQAILLAGDGRFSFKGSGYVRGGIFDRFQIIQGDTSIRFHDNYHKRLRRLATEGAPKLKDVDLFRSKAGPTNRIAFCIFL